MTFARRSLAALAAAVLTTSAAPASAAPIDNPGSVTLDWPSGSSPFLEFDSGHELHQAGSTLEFDVDGSGNVTFVSAVTAYETLSPSVSVGGQVLQAQLQIIDMVGTLNAATGDWDVTLTARVRFKTSGGAVPSTCATGFFDIQVIEYDPHAGSVEFDLDPSEPFVIPTVSGAQCGGASNASAINTTLNLGGTGPSFQFYKVQQSPTLTGS